MRRRGRFLCEPELCVSTAFQTSLPNIASKRWKRGSKGVVVLCVLRLQPAYKETKIRLSKVIAKSRWVSGAPSVIC